MAFIPEDFNEMVRKWFPTEIADDILAKLEVGKCWTLRNNGQPDQFGVWFTYQSQYWVFMNSEEAEACYEILKRDFYDVQEEVVDTTTIDANDIEYMEGDEFGDGYYYNKFTGKIVEDVNS